MLDADPVERALLSALCGALLPGRSYDAEERAALLVIVARVPRVSRLDARVEVEGKVQRVLPVRGQLEQVSPGIAPSRFPERVGLLSLVRDDLLLFDHAGPAAGSQHRQRQSAHKPDPHSCLPREPFHLPMHYRGTRTRGKQQRSCLDVRTAWTAPR